MAAKSSADDPMDLGPFLQNYVMQNPFKAAGAAATVDGLASSDRPGGRSTGRWRGSWPRLTAALRARRRGHRASALNGVDGDDVVAQRADLLRHNAETSEAEVTTWYV